MDPLGVVEDELELEELELDGREGVAPRASGPLPGSLSGETPCLLSKAAFDRISRLCFFAAGAGPSIGTGAGRLET